MNERGISVDEVSETIDRGVKRFEKRKIMARYRRIEVVYQKIPCHNFVITAYGR